MRWLPVLLLAGCYSPSIPNGQQQCAPGGGCAEGYVCAADNHCYKMGQLPKGDMAGADFAGVDLAGVDSARAGDAAGPQDLSTPPDMARCVGDPGCAGTPATPRCDVASGTCVECLVQNDNCGAGRFCDGTTHTCKQGCALDADCTGAGTPRCCNHVCADVSTDGMNCGMCGTACGAGSACCSSTCTDTTMNLNDCGGCGLTCTGKNANWKCAASACAVSSCTAGYGDCNAMSGDGCEIHLTNDVNNCTVCGMKCGAVPNATVGCASGCVIQSCSAGFGNCDAQYANGCEVNLNTDVGHCGNCMNACAAVANGTRACAAGACVVASCNAGFGNCNGVYGDGCETNLNTDVKNCGMCGLQCPMTQMCVAGKCQSCYMAGSQTFNYTGGQQSFTVPCGVTSVSLTVRGAQGANANDRLPTAHTPGLGGSATGTLAVVAGQVLNVFVGGQGSAAGPGGYNGGGVGGTATAGVMCSGGPAGGGGGSSDVRVGGVAFGNIVIAAGGGGGAGRDYCNGTCQPCGCGSGNGGGGGLSGVPGLPGHDCGFGYGGTGVNGGGGGLANAGGAAGAGDGGGPAGLPGAQLTGGAGGNGPLDVAGGGGGGGYYGGGGGGTSASNGVGGGGGGGGSSYVGGVQGGGTTPAVQAGNGQVVITW